MNVDFGLTANDYASYRAGFPEEFFKCIFDEKIIEAGASLVDIETGTLARGFALRSCHVTVLDPSQPLMDQSKELDALAGVIIFENWRRFGNPPAVARDIAKAGFVDIRTFSFDVDVPYMPEAWRRRKSFEEKRCEIRCRVKEILEKRNQLKVQKEAGASSVMQIQHRVFAISAHK